MFLPPLTVNRTIPKYFRVKIRPQLFMKLRGTIGELQVLLHTGIVEARPQIGAVVRCILFPGAFQGFVIIFQFFKCYIGVFGLNCFQV